MPGIEIRHTSRGSLISDIQEVARKLSKFPKVVVLEGERIKKEVIKISSSLFPEENLILFIVDPEKDLLKEIKPHLDELKKRIWIVIYETKSESETIPNRSRWIEDERVRKRKVLSILREYGKKMTDKAYSLFVQRVGDDNLFENELLKLINFVGEKEEIRSKDVEEIVSRQEEGSLLYLLEATRDMNKEKAIEVLATLFNSGINPLVIHSYLSRVVRLLIQAKEISSLLDPSESFYKKFSDLKNLYPFLPEDKKNYFLFLHPKYALSLAQLAKKFSLDRLLDLYDSLTTCDLKIKTGTKFELIILETILMENLDA